MSRNDYLEPRHHLAPECLQTVIVIVIVIMIVARKRQL